MGEDSDGVSIVDDRRVEADADASFAGEEFRIVDDEAAGDAVAVDEDGVLRAADQQCAWLPSGYIFEPPGETHTLIVLKYVSETTTLFQVNGLMLCRKHCAACGLCRNFVDAFVG